MTRSIASMFLLAVSTMALAACAAKTPPPAIAYDLASFQPAVVQPDPPKPVKIVKVPQPLPLPGQLKPPPSSSSTPDSRPPAARVEAADWAALREPTKDGYINAVQVYPFSEGALYRLYAAPEEVTDIALQPGESLSAISSGDTVRWVVGDTTSGTGSAKQVHVLVKPFAAGLKSNLVIATDRRTYHLALESTDKTSMAAISWTYPQDALLAVQKQNAHAEAAAPIANTVTLENLHFRYEIAGDKPPWRPLRAFDDGSKVFIEFPARLDQGEAPPLFVVGADGDNQLVNYRVRGNFYVVDRLFAAAELRLGTSPQQVVRISRTDVVKSASSGRRGAERR